MGYKQGDRVFCNGYPGAIVRQYELGMWEVRLPGGVTCVAESTFQPIDSKPGNYYVSVRKDSGDWRVLLGPFPNDHAAALAWVDKARRKAEEIDPKAIWYSYGTVRLPIDAALPNGALNRFFPEAFQPSKEIA